MIDKGELEQLEKHTTQKFRQHWMQEVRETIRQCDILVVDEMSMLTGEFIEAMDTTLRVARRSPSKMFGGLTLFLVGDYRQLPPVSKSRYGYSFQHPNWQNKTWFKNVFTLNFILRQSGDVAYSEIILSLSHNSLTQNNIDTLLERVVPDGKEKIMDVSFLPNALRVFHTNREVNMYNEAFTMRAISEGRDHARLGYKLEIPSSSKQDFSREVKQMCDDMVYSKEIFVGSQVIITANMNVASGIVNGTAGKVMHIDRDVSGITDMYGGKELSLVVTLKLDDQRIVKIGCHCISKTKERGYTFTHSQIREEVVKGYCIPLLLSHAITVYRLQGSTVRRPLFYMPRSLGQYSREFYVISTRVTSIDYLYLTHLPHSLTRVVDPQVIDLYQSLFNKVISN